MLWAYKSCAGARNLPRYGSHLPAPYRKIRSGWSQYTDDVQRPAPYRPRGYDHFPACDIKHWPPRPLKQAR